MVAELSNGPNQAALIHFAVTVIGHADGRVSEMSGKLSSPLCPSRG